MSQTSTLKGQCIAEFLGTGLLIFFGVGCVAALKVAGASFGQWEISVIWGLGVFMLAGCAKPPTTIEVSPTITLPQQDPSLMGVTVSINGADQRTDQALAKVTRDNQIVTLTASRDLRFLLQEVLEKQMTARGYMVGPNGPVNLQIIVSQLYADVSQGNVRYNIATKADIAIIATAQNGNKMTKNYRASYNVEGAFQASNKNIADAVNSVLTDTIADMSQDTSIHEFIKQNAR